MYKHLWTDATFEENIFCGYAMISYTALGKPEEEIIYYEACYHHDLVDYSNPIKRGTKIPVYRNITTIAELIDLYKANKSGIDQSCDIVYPEDIQAYIEDPYMILRLVSDIQWYTGWFNDGCAPEEYTLSELKRLLGGYK